MKMSHRQTRLILRILHCVGIFFGLFTFIYEIFLNHSILNILSYICYLLAASAILYLLFTRKQPNHKFAYGTFYAMSFVTLLFLLMYIYESATLVSNLTNGLISHIERNTEVDPSLVVIIKISKCCSINDEKHTNENFARFQGKYQDTCGRIKFDEAMSCLPFIRDQRNFRIFLYCIIMIIRLLALFLLWRYIKNEYNGGNDESMSGSNTDTERSPANIIA